MKQKDEWTQEEFYKYKKELEEQGTQVVLVDTILKPIEGMKTVKYNPFELQKYPHGTVFVFYCDTGKTSKERLEFFKNKLPQYRCVSLKGGRGYWRPFFQDNA
jgi:hypothetical protein